MEGDARRRTEQAPDWVRRSAVVCGTVTIALGALMVLGWLRGFSQLTDTFPSLPAMKANTSIGVLFAGASLLGTRRARWWATVPLVVGAATLAQWVTGRPLGIDELLARDPFATSDPGRPSPQMALTLLLFGTARLTTGLRGRRGTIAGTVVTLFMATGLTVLLGSLLRAPELTSAGGEAGISIASAVAVAVLMTGLLARNADRGPLSYLWDRGPTGTVVRRLLPTAVLAPPGLGVLFLAAEDAGVFGAHLAMALFAGSMVALLVAVATTTARSLHEVEHDRTTVSRELAAIFDSVPALLTLRDPEGRIVRMNQPSDVPGGDAGAVGVGRLAQPAYPEEVRAELAAQDREVLTTGRPSTRTIHVDSRQGRRDLEVTRFVVRDADDSLIGIGGFTLDVTARATAERAAAEAIQRLQSYLDSAPDATVVVDEGGRVQYANRQVRDLLGYEPEELLGRSVDVLVPDVSRSRHADQRATYAAHPTHRQMGSGLDLTARHRDGHTVPVEISLGPIPTEHGVWVAAAIRDVSMRRATEAALREAEQRARHLAEHDPLTGVRNRRRFELELVGMLDRAPATARDDAALVLIDIDYFKTVNDGAGHDAGDRLLMAVAAALTRCVGDDGSVSRLGGDEFALLVTGERDRVAALAEQALSAIREAVTGCGLGAAGDLVSASAGVAHFADLAPDQRVRRSVMLRADDALYAAKDAGRNRYVVYAPPAGSEPLQT